MKSEYSTSGLGWPRRLAGQ